MSYAVECSDLCIELATGSLHDRSLKQTLLDSIRRGTEADQTQRILNGISFTAAGGEKIGIVGGNGAGKTTLLRTIAGVYPPTSGTVTVNGSISPIMDIHGGMAPDLSGRENIFLMASILGIPNRETQENLLPIVSFSGLEADIDKPVRIYSDGMRARLAFAVATQFFSDIVLLDETLAVGDYEFSKRCTDRLSGAWATDKTVFIVSHDLAQIQSLCQRALWLDGGCLREDGEVNLVLGNYISHIRTTGG